MASGQGVAFRGAPQRGGQGMGMFRTLTMDPALGDGLSDFIRRTTTISTYSGDQEAPLTARAKRIRRVVTVRTFLLLVGTLIVLLMCVIPLADAIRLLEEPTYVFFMGRDWPRLMIVACVCSIVGYGAIIVVFFKFSKVEYKTEQTVMMIGMMVCTALGLSLLCISQPLSKRTLVIYTDLFFHCDLGQGLQTQRLYEYAMILQLMRARPECAKMRSVEDCAGYQEKEPYTSYLRTLENRYKCSGFCSDARVSLYPSPYPFNFTNVTTNGTEGTVALQQHSQGQLATALQGLTFRHSIERLKFRKTGELSVESADKVERDMARQNEMLLASNVHVERSPAVLRHDIHRGTRSATMEAYQPGVLDNYPPTLFSQANYKISCEGQAARALKYEALDVARVLYIEGLALLFITVAISMVKLAGLWDSSWYSSDSRDPRRPKEVVL